MDRSDDRLYITKRGKESCDFASSKGCNCSCDNRDNSEDCGVKANYDTLEGSLNRGSDGGGDI